MIEYEPTGKMSPEEHARAEAASSDILTRAMTAAEHPPQQDRPQVPLAVDTAKEQAQSDEQERLAVMALLHQAWTRELVRKRGFSPVIGTADMQALELARKAFELIPAKNPKVV